MKNIYRVAVVEDEDICLDALTSMLERYGKERDVHIEVSAFRSIETFLLDYKSLYDLVLMDIKLPGMNGMDGARKLRQIDSVVTLIFITSMAQFAVNGYEVSALDYLIKPVSYSNFSIKLDRAVGIISSRENKRIVVYGKEEVNSMNVHDIVYVEVRGHHLIFHKTDGNEVDVCGSLSELSENLRESGFSRCNSCYLVNMKYVSKINSLTITVMDGTEIQISRRKRKAFIDEYTQYVGGSGGL